MVKKRIEPVEEEIEVTPVAPSYTPDPNEAHMNVLLQLPRSALLAALDPTSSVGDVQAAEYYGLLHDGQLTVIGAKVVAGSDQTALRHILAAEGRAAYNARVDKR